MREAFSQHFATDQDRRVKLWENCLFVFDTNVLTGIYRRSEEARDAQYKLMRALDERLWIPHRVIYEFLDNRAKIVHDQAQLYVASITELQGMLSGFEVVTKHPFLSAEVYGEFNTVSQKVLAELEASRQFYDGRITNDDVKDVLAEILAGKVGSAFTEERLVEIVKEGEQRYAQNIPPGFEDKGKHKGSTITEEIRKRYGDLIIWYQVIEKAKEEQRPVILVTGDQKPDWWAEQSGKKLGPLPALIEEFNALTGQDFYLYSYHGFLNFANEYLDQKTSESVIEEVREAALDDAVEWQILHDDGTLDQAWLSASFEDISVSLGQNSNIDPNIISARAAAQQSLTNLIAARQAYQSALTATRSPNDPREVRRRKRAAESMAKLEEQIIEEQRRLHVLNSFIHSDGRS